MTSATPVIFDHDGGIDDLLSLLLLLRLPNIDVLGVTITPADCYPDDALLSTRKILTLTGNTHIPVSVGQLTGPNPFPPEWRAQPKMCHATPVMLRTAHDSVKVEPTAAHEWMQSALVSASSPVTILMTGPATNLATALTQQPELVSKVSKVVWMGGAVKVKGNVAMHDHDGSAEWNAYWDPKATKNLVDSGVNLLLVPLDATNDLPVSWDFLQKLADRNTPVSDLAGQFWASTVTAIPSYEFTYFLWDILSTCILAIPDAKLSIETGQVAVSTTTPNAGQTYLCDETGSQISWVSKVDADYVRAMVVYYLSGEFSETPVTFVN
ncbi:nucleoside hydrolase [Alteromonas sp. 1_MG-2023]|uniref:nucleoside hydrolase n=1 Tax=Alteromonas sp. 1_MG-2023 TaxID=3062669 RepID=UPI0026E444E2|nr:nucleoside hydrolase [Alteromonas sp. 1_MG-2023]MDO6567534.1 nucleoside hydrolase [Alteromonas sp. 1_MG-2023]